MEHRFFYLIGSRLGKYFNNNFSKNQDKATARNHNMFLMNW